MKKLAFVLGLFLMCTQLLVAQLAIEAVPAFEIIEHDQKAWHLEDADPYFYKTQLGFTADSVWYIVSYEPHREGHHYGDAVKDRNLYLYKRKINSTEEWTKAIAAPLLRSHSWYGNIHQTYDPCALNSDEKGTSSIEFVTVDGEDIIVIFMGIETKFEATTDKFTEMFLIYKRKENNGFIHYDHLHYTLTRDHSGIFPYSSRKGNVFYDTDGYTVTIFANDNKIGFTYNHPKNGCTFTNNRNNTMRMKSINK